MSTINGTTIYRKRGGTTIAHPIFCVLPRVMKTFNHGFWYGYSPLNFSFSIFVVKMIVLFFLCRLVHFALRPLRQPKLVCYVLAGIILGPSALGHSEIIQQKLFPVDEVVMLNTMSSLFTAYYAFIGALKIDLSMLLRIARDAWIIGVSNFFVPMIVSIFLVSKLQDHFPAFGGSSSIVTISALFSTSFFTVVTHHMEEYNLITSELGQLAMSSAVIGEIIFFVVVFLERIFRQTSIFLGIQTTLPLLAMALFATYILRPAILWVIRRTPEGKPVDQTYIIAVLLGVSIMAAVTDLLGGNILLGAAVVGFLIPDGSSLARTIAERSELIIMEFFVPFSFVQIGYLTNVRSIKDMNNFSLLLFFIILIYSAKLLGTILASLFFKIRVRKAILLGFSLNIKGIMEFVYFQIWLMTDILDTQSFTTLVLCNLFCTAIFSPLIDIFHKPQVRLKADACGLPKTLQSTLQHAELCVLPCILEEDNVHSIITLLEAFTPNATSPICIYLIHLIELVGQASPLLVSYNNHIKRFKPYKSGQIVDAFRNYSKNSRGPVTIQPFALIAPYKTMDNIICNFVQDKNIPLIIVPFYGNQEVDQITRTLLKSFNARLQAHATCTVGILVDGGLSLQMNVNNFFCNAVAIFLGGCDCREALTLAIRMSENPNVSITMLKIVLKDNNNNVHINETERQQDELLVKEFKDKSANNANAVFQEVAADNSIQVMDAIRSLENKYDLVILGRRWGIETEMVDWVEHLELGVLGDVLASSDYKGRTSVLVMQRSALIDA